jgi:predicted MFS family arabinose efflux permease
MRSDSPWRIRDFRTLFTSATLSHLGFNINYVAMPLVAVVALGASPGQVGVLAALSTSAFLLIGLPAGAWVDRMRQRRVLIVAELVRALLYLSVPVAWWLDVLTLSQLYAVVLLNSCATVFFDVASQSVLPQVVGRESLVPANAAVASLMAAGNVVGRGAGGGLVQILTAPVAVLCTVVGYLVSALCLTRLRGISGAGSLDQERSTGFLTQVAQGVRHVLGGPELRALALTGALTNLGIQMINTMLPILFVRELGLSPGALGLFLASGGLGMFLGARVTRPVAEFFGYGRALAVVGLCLSPAALLIPLVGNGPWLWLAALGWVLAMVKTGMDNVLGVSLRQRLTSYALLGRMNATFRFLLTGAFAIGGVLAGLIGELAGGRAALWAGAVILALAFVPVMFSPVRVRRTLPAQADLIPTR